MYGPYVRAIGLISLIFLAYQNCSDVKFSEGNLPVLRSSIEDDKENKIITESFDTVFDVKTISSNMDVVWVVDNSGSMALEAAHVRDNILNFANQFSPSSDARMILIGRNGTTGTTVTIPTNDPRFFQLDLKVASTNSLILLDGLWNQQHTMSSEFFAAWRTGVPKAIVFVTDDNSSISASSFLSSMPSSIKQDIEVFHSIVALETKELSPCMAKPGSVYWDLSHQTDGDILNICETDWSSIFTTLASKIETRLSIAGKTNFKLFHPNITELLSVKINGEPLTPQQFQISESYLTISEGAFKGDITSIFSIEVRYKYE